MLSACCVLLLLRRASCCACSGNSSSSKVANTNRVLYYAQAHVCLSPLFLCLSNALTHTLTFNSHTQSLLMCCLIKRQKCYRKLNCTKESNRTLDNFHFVSSGTHKMPHWLRIVVSHALFGGYSIFVGCYRQRRRRRQKFTIVDATNNSCSFKNLLNNNMCVEIVAAQYLHFYFIVDLCWFALKTKWPRCCVSVSFRILFFFFDSTTTIFLLFFFQYISFFSVSVVCVRVYAVSFLFVSATMHTTHSQACFVVLLGSLRFQWYNTFFLLLLVCVLTLICMYVWTHKKKRPMNDERMKWNCT